MGRYERETRRAVQPAMIPPKTLYVLDFSVEFGRFQPVGPCRRVGGHLGGRTVEGPGPPLLTNALTGFSISGPRRLTSFQETS